MVESRIDIAIDESGSDTSSSDEEEFVDVGRIRPDTEGSLSMLDKPIVNYHILPPVDDVLNPTPISPILDESDYIHQETITFELGTSLVYPYQEI